MVAGNGLPPKKESRPWYWLWGRGYWVIIVTMFITSSYVLWWRLTTNIPINAAVEFLIDSFVVMTITQLWFAVCVHRTVRDKEKLVKKIVPIPTYSTPFEASERFGMMVRLNAVGHWRHCWYRLTFRDPLKLYSGHLLRWLMVQNLKGPQQPDLNISQSAGCQVSGVQYNPPHHTHPLHQYHNPPQSGPPQSPALAQNALLKRKSHP